MKIYTKTGDAGETSLFRGGRVSKDNGRIESYGTVDELNSILGLALCELKNNDIKKIINQIQNQLFILGSDLATPFAETQKKDYLRINSKHIEELESLIDRFDAGLPTLQNFVLPGGSSGSSLLHVARTICRRAERKVVSLSRSTDVGEFVIKYLNRLSDLLFVLSRYENHANNVPDIIWEP